MFSKGQRTDLTGINCNLIKLAVYRQKKPFFFAVHLLKAGSIHIYIYIYIYTHIIFQLVTDLMFIWCHSSYLVMKTIFLKSLLTEISLRVFLCRLIDVTHLRWAWFMVMCSVWTKPDMRISPCQLSLFVNLLKNPSQSRWCSLQSNNKLRDSAITGLWCLWWSGQVHRPDHQKNCGCEDPQKTKCTQRFSSRGDARLGYYICLAPPYPLNPVIVFPLLDAVLTDC